MDREPSKGVSATGAPEILPDSDSPGTPLRGVWIVVLTWNARDLAEACLESLEPARSRGASVLVVDNASSDGTSDRLRERFPGVPIVVNAANLGFSGGNNVGIRHALAAGAEFVILLNQDATVAPEWCDELVAAARRHPEAGSVGSKIFFADRKDVIWHAGATLSTLSGRSRHLGYGDRDSGQFDDDRWVERPCACALLLRRSFLEAFGPLDETLFLYGEEIDLVLRAGGRGFTHLLAPRAMAWHHVSTATGGTRSGEYLYYVTRNTLYLLRRHAPMRFAWLEGLREVLIVSTLAASILTMRLEKQPAWRALRDGWRDYRQGHMGPRLAAGQISSLATNESHR